MAQYKAVPTPLIEFSDEEDLYLQLQTEYAEELTKESGEGWQFVGIYPYTAMALKKGGLVKIS